MSSESIRPPFKRGRCTCDSGYSVQQVKRVEPDYTFSVPIMAGFLGSRASELDNELDNEINQNINYLYENDICNYGKTYQDGSRTRVLWRCSISSPEWRANRPTSVDFSSMVFGYALNFLEGGDEFFERYAVWLIIEFRSHIKKTNTLRNFFKK